MRRCAFVFAVSLALTLVSSPSFAQDKGLLPAAHTGSEPWSLDILFTGRLLGYFRNPELQSGSFSKGSPSCPAVPVPSSEGKTLYSAVQSYPRESRLFLGTGDNFALYLPSRIFVPLSPGKSKGQYAKDQLDWDPANSEWITPRTRDALDRMLRQGLGVVPTDNVGCYLAYAGYDAIVPGKEDFYFGAARLQALARFLASLPPGDKFYSPVQMLAANLLVKTTWLNDHDPIPDSKKPRLEFDISDLSKDPHVVFPADGAEILPWLSEVEGTLNAGADAVEVVISGPLDDPDGKDWTVAFENEVLHITHTGESPCWSEPSIKRYEVSGCADLLRPTVLPVHGSGPVKARWPLSPLKPLAPGNYRACIWPALDEKTDQTKVVRPTCSRFSVGLPFLQYANGGMPAPTGTAFQEPSPYFVKRVCTQAVNGACVGKRVAVAVFGVVDPDFEEKVGKLNSVWITVGSNGKDAKKYDTSLEVLDPAKTLKQLIDYLVSCSERGNDKDSCYGAAPGPTEPRLKFKSKVLLTQMEAVQATILATKLMGKYRFDAVISAYDEQQFTRNQISVVDPTISATDEQSDALDCTNKYCEVPPFVAVPPPAWDPTWSGDPSNPSRRGDPVRVLRISDNALHQRQYEVKGATSQIVCSDCVLPAAKDALHASRMSLAHEKQLSAQASQILMNSLKPMLPEEVRPQLPQTPLKLLEDATLHAMREETHADIALVQKHDFYLAPLVDCLLHQTIDGTVKCPEVEAAGTQDNYSWQKILDALIWKGDILTVIPVRGSVLQAVMKRSHQYDANDDSSLSLKKEQGRGLVALGLKPDGFKDSYRVNDLPLDPNRLYSVATTDYIALGDTGYPDLIDPNVPSFPRPLYDKRNLKYVSSLVCHYLVQSLGIKNQDCAPNFKSNEYFDELTVRQPGPPAGDTWQERWKRWFEFWRRLGQDGYTKSGQDLESWSQEHPPAWKLSLKTSLGFNVQRHSDTQAELNSEFGGVSNPQASAPRSHSWAADQEMSYIYNASLFDFVGTEALLYNASFADARSGAYRNPNQSTDSIMISLGPRFHLYQKRRQPYWGIWTYLHYDTQPVSLLQSLNLTMDKIDVRTPLQFFLPRVHTLTGRVGIGRYDQKSYFEIGAEGGQAFGAFNEFDIYTAGVLVLPCIPSATQSLQKCISTMGDTIVTPSSTVKTLQSTRNRTGFYWHSLLVLPTGKRMSASLENQGEFYFNNAGDNSTDTRIQHLVTAKYSFQVWPSLSFAPTYQIFLYENKQAYMSLWQQQAMITINFNFDWTSKRIGPSQVEYKPVLPQ